METLTGLEREWRALWHLDPRATPFQSPDWLLPWARWLWGGGRICSLAVRSGSRLVALAPLFRWGADSSRISFLGSGISDYLDLLALPEFAAQAARLVLTYLAEIQPCWNVCDLQELRSGSPLLEMAGGEWRDLSCGTCPVLELPRCIEELEERLPAKMRNLRRAENRLRRDRVVEFIEADQHDWRDLLEYLFELHSARWEQQRDPGVLSGRALQGFHQEAVGDFLRSGMLRLYALTAAGRPIAAQYNLAAKGRFYFYLSGFNPEWGQYSPGALLVRFSVTRAIAEGASEVDFLRKSESFKYQWGAKDRFNHRLLAERVAGQAREVA